MFDDPTCLLAGDCLDVMATLGENSIDTIITDPPYGLNFMGKKWDYQIPSVEVWQAALRVAKPGATLLCFAGTRTHHRMAVSIEDAGWIMRDTIMWIYGSGFPKSLDVSKAIDKSKGMDREVVGKYLRPDGSGIRENCITPKFNGKYNGGLPGGDANDSDITAPASDLAQTFDGWGSGLKPSFEPILVFQKPLDGTYANNAEVHGVAGYWIDGARIETVDDLSGGTYGGVFSGTRDSEGNLCKAIGSGDKGRWPANLIHDGSDEVMAEFDKAGERPSGTGNKFPANNHRLVYGKGLGYSETPSIGGDTGSAARFFYCAKASKGERGNGNNHPTVKPLALMRYLCRLTKTPTGGIVLDPFTGSGTTGMAAVLEGRYFVGIEREADYVEIAKRRIEAAQETAEAERRMPRQLSLIGATTDV